MSSRVAFDVTAKKEELFKTFKHEFDKAQAEGHESLAIFFDCMAYSLGSHIPVVATDTGCGPMLVGVVNSMTDGMQDSMQVLGSKGILTKIVRH